MALHLIKICVGIDSIGQLAEWQALRRKEMRKKTNHHITRHFPKRADEILAGGSLYWIIRGFIQVRQRVVGFHPWRDPQEGEKCKIELDATLVPTEPMARRPHQGWRYFETKDAPHDLTARSQGLAEMPPDLLKELKALGLI